MGDTKYLEDVNLSELRKEYVNYYWESGQYDEQLSYEYEKAFLYMKQEMAPYFNNAANYEETEDGCKF